MLRPIVNFSLSQTKMLCLLDWYAFEVFLSSDGAHFVRIWPWAASTDDLAVSFYKNGKEVKNYRIKDLVQGASSTGEESSGTMTKMLSYF